MANILFSYWGRRGAISQFVKEIIATAPALPGTACHLSISRQNELFSSFVTTDAPLLPVSTFSENAGALLSSWHIPAIRHQLDRYIRQHRIDAVVELMPHVWSPLITPVITKAGAKYCTIVHDADLHPGDRTSRAKFLHDRTLLNADLVLTLSQAVAGRVAALNLVEKGRIFPLFHPDMYAGQSRVAAARYAPGDAIRLLFFGRIARYKGLAVFLDTIETLRDRGQRVEGAVIGQGDVADYLGRLDRLEISLINRWVAHEEIPDLVSAHHAVVLSHVEASQSGVAAAALGVGVPPVVTPVGGLIEQVEDGRTGIVARAADSDALADAVERLFLTPDLHEAIQETIVSTRHQRSMQPSSRIVSLTPSMPAP